MLPGVATEGPRVPATVRNSRQDGDGVGGPDGQLIRGNLYNTVFTAVTFRPKPFLQPIVKHNKDLIRNLHFLCILQEANKMVQDANIKRMQSEKLLNESEAKVRSDVIIQSSV